MSSSFDWLDSFRLVTKANNSPFSVRTMSAVGV